MRRTVDLADYEAKRRFGATPEPRGRRRRAKGWTYAIQKHAARRLHFDLRLELDGVLKSWAITRGPSLDPTEKRLAVRTEDHPVDYAGFEGVIPAGNYGAGTVMLWDRGTWEPLDDPHRGLSKGKLTFRLHGERLTGDWALVRMASRKGEERDNWLLVKMKDDDARRRGDVVARNVRSVASERTLAEIERGTAPIPPVARSASQRPPAKSPSPPAFVPPQLATLVEEVPTGKEWLFELKYDGYRLIVAATGDNVRIFTRNRQDWTRRFPRIAAAVASLDLDRVLVDGEVAALDANGRTDFGLLQRKLDEGDDDLTFFAFDLLAEGGRSLRRMPLADRKAKLRQLLRRAPRRGPLHFSSHVGSDGEKALQAVCAQGMEGLIAKRRDGTYRSGRTRSWLKIKCGREDEFVIVGWSPSDRGRPFASLLLASPEGKTLRYAGRVGTGFSDRALERLHAMMARSPRRTPPIDNARRAPRDAHWVAPTLHARVAFAELTRDGLVRHARFLGLREDVPRRAASPEADVKDVEVEIAGVRLSHPDRVLFPEQGITKAELARYYAAAAPRMLPYLAGRPISLVRCPSGRAKQCFFQRHGGAGLPAAFRRIPVTGKSGAEEYVAIDDVHGLVEAAQIGVLELHLWGARADAVDRPERIVFDLDPDPTVPFARVRDAAIALRDALAALGLRSFALLTGGKGIHVVVPIARRSDWPTVKSFARALAERFAAADPDAFVATMSKARRKNRIFIDYLRNDRGATAIAPYSPRARAGAPVAWPVAWSELDRTVSATTIDMRMAIGLLKRADPWRGYHGVRQTLGRAMLRATGL